MSFATFLALYAGAIGLLVGSYLNVVVHRLPQGLSTVTPRSRCPRCGATIRALDNIPVVSWLRLRGRCRACGGPISLRYPAIELLVGTLFALCVVRFGATRAAAAAALLVALLVALAGIDVDHFYLPDRITLPGLALGLALRPLVGWGSLASALAGALAGAGILLAFAGAWKLAKGVEGMGLGDVKMLAMIGAFLGPGGVAVTLVFSAASGATVGLAMLARGRGTLETKLPFGLFLALGGIVALYFGEPLARFYLGLL